jgi:hypothetical protein
VPAIFDCTSNRADLRNAGSTSRHVHPLADKQKAGARGSRSLQSSESTACLRARLPRCPHRKSCAAPR